jgi:formylglycine-generating enzyme required for sulfatase activity
MPVLEVSTANLRQELRSARAESDRLFSILTETALYARPIAERHRVIFYVGHLDGFDSIQICREALGVKMPEPQLDALFQAGIDPDSSHLPSDQPSDWPTLEQVQAYVRRSRELVDQHIERAPDDVALMALEHRLMHLETLAYMFHNFGYDLKNGHLFQQQHQTGGSAHKNSWRDVPSGKATLGKPRGSEFGWDNEYEENSQHVPAFRMQRFNVTNGEYLQFVRQGAPLPHFWVQRNGSPFYRGMFEEIPLPLDWPVYVTQAQADAYARWIGKALPTEEQFHRATYGSPAGAQSKFPWGEKVPGEQRGNFDFRRWDPEPVSSSPQGDSAFGISQLIGNGWEWTSTIFGPFPGFQPRPTYPGYSANFFDGEHAVIKGGSPRTAARLLRRSFRNWFRRDYPYVYATFRCVEN